MRSGDANKQRLENALSELTNRLKVNLIILFKKKNEGKEKEKKKKERKKRKKKH